ncbi:MAG: winged helix-turn-helix domain-containing protein [Chloroflexota bacterium]
MLVVEDEKTVAEVVDKYLRREGYCVSVSHDGAAALEHMRTEGADLLVLDLMLPGVDGLEVARRLRERGDRTPIIMLTAKDEESDIVLGLGLGADDYVSKPFSPRELVARVQAVLRRGEGSSASGPLIRTGDLRISVETRSVECAGQSLSLTAKEFDLLHFLATHPGQVFTRDQLLNRVWDYTYAGDTSTVTVHIRRLRSKVEADPERPRHIKTVWGVGYKFDV